MSEGLVVIDPGFLGEYGIGKWGTSYWSSAINHGITQIAGVCKAHNVSVHLMDLRCYSSYIDFEKDIKKRNETWYAITCRTVDVPVVENIIAIIRKQKPDAKIIVGGIHVNLVPDIYIADTRIDYVFLGEADITLPQLLANPGKFSKVVKGEIPTIDDIPFENIDIYNYKKSISFTLYEKINIVYFIWRLSKISDDPADYKQRMRI